MRSTSTFRLALSVALLFVLAAPAARAQPSSAPPPPTAVPPAPPQSGPPAAQRTQGRKLGVLVRMALDFGGAKLAEVKWTDGKSTTLKAGQLFTFAAGLLYHPDAPWALEATLGYKFDQANGSNGSIGFSRIPLDIVASYAHGRHRFGLGPTVHLAPKFSCDATGACSPTTYEIKYDTALGGILQYAYGIPLGRSAGLDIAVRYTIVEYKGGTISPPLAGMVAKDLNGSAPGFVLGAWF